MPVVAAEGLTKRYASGVLAVDHANLRINPGEVYGLLGPNGAGKTTLLRMLLGLLRPTAGAATVLGERPGAPAGLARIGALVEEPGLYPYLSGRDNLLVLARYAGVNADKVDEALAAVGLEERAGDKVQRYSLGMRQRLGVAAALLKEPELLVLDEPTNGLDPRGMTAMRTLLRSLGAAGKTVVLSSHLLGEVEQVCDRVGVINGGRLVAEGSVEELRGLQGLVMVAEPVETAMAVIAQWAGPDAVSVVDRRLQVALDPSQAADLNAALVAAGVRVSELRPTQRSLEDVFFAVTAAKVAP